MMTKHRKALQAWVNEDGFEAVAGALSVTENTVARWLAGLSSPHANTKEKLLDALASRTRKG